MKNLVQSPFGMPYFPAARYTLIAPQQRRKVYITDLLSAASPQYLDQLRRPGWLPGFAVRRSDILAKVYL
jgi:hypothetical protein